MTQRRARWLAGAMLALTVAMLGTAVAFHAAGWSQCAPAWRAASEAGRRACDIVLRNNDLGGTAEMLAFAGVGVVFTALGALLATKRSDNVLGWIFGGAGLLFVSNAFLNTYVVHGATEAPGSLPAATFAAALAEPLGGPVVFTPFVFFFLLFPSGALLSRRWRPVGWALGATAVIHSTMLLLHPRPLRLAPLHRNPLAVQWVTEEVQMVVDAVSMAVLFGALIAAVVSLVLRFRRSRGVERQQMKWFTTSAAFVGVTLLSGPLLWASESLEPVWGPLFLLATLSVPAAATVAILRHRLYDIDVLINRALVYGALTGVLGAVYLGIVVAFQPLVSGGDASNVVVAGSTLAVAALFRPVRSRVQAFIDRRFYRRKYDAARTVESFNARLRQETDLAQLQDQLLHVVHETVQPAATRLWLRRDVRA